MTGLVACAAAAITVVACSAVKPRPPTKVDDPAASAGSGNAALGATSRLGAVPGPDAAVADAAPDAYVPPPIAANIVADLEAKVKAGRAAYVALFAPGGAKAAAAFYATAQRVVGSGGCAAVPPTKAEAAAAPTLVLACTGGSGRLAVTYATSTGARGYDLVTIYDDHE